MATKLEANVYSKDGKETSKALEVGTEYDRHTDASWDPFAKIHGLA